MNLASIAFAYARRSPFMTLLNVALLMLGVATMTLLLLLSRALDERMQRDAQGIDLVVGAKGSPMQLILAGVFQVDVPPGNIPLAEVQKLRENRLVKQVIPISLGDSYRGFRIVGTEPPLVPHYGATLASGRLWRAPLEAVLGSEVAHASGLAIGDSFAGTHGLVAGGEEHSDNPYRVVGILHSTGSVVDRLVLTSLESVWKIHEHEEVEHAGQAATVEGTGPDAAPSGASKAWAEPSEREVTMALVQYATPLAVASLPRAIDRETSMQAASPAYESARLFSVFGVGADVLRGFAVVLVIAATLGIFIALYQSMNERQFDIAIMRTLGASRAKVCSMLLLESLFLAAAGALAGIALAHAILASIGRWLPEAASLAYGASRLIPGEAAVLALVLVAGVLAALTPAWRAYRLDVASVLAKG